MPAGLFHEAIDLAQAQARSAASALRCVERVKRALDDLWRHACPRVGDSDEHVLACGNLRVLTGISFVKVRVRSFNRQAAAVGHGVAGIDAQVQEGVLKLAGVGIGPPKPTR